MKQTITKLLGGVFLAALCLVSDPASATITATWDFAGNLPVGIQSATNYGKNKEVFINSTQDGVNLYVNTGTSGKFSMNGGTSYIQMNTGTIVRVPVVTTNDIVTISFAGNAGYCTLSSPHTATSAEVEQGYVEFSVSENSTYINSISVSIAYLPPVKPVIAWDWENDESIRTFETIQKGSSKETGTFVQIVNGESYTLTVDCTEGGKFGPNNNVPQFTTGAKLKVPVTSTSDVVTIKRYGSSADGKKIVIRETDYTELITQYTAVAADVSQGYVEITSGCDYLYSVKLEKNEYFTTATIGSYGWATFSNSAATDFTNLAGVVDAYTVTGASGTAITTSAVTSATANTGLLLKANAGTYAIPLVSSGTDLSGSNLLKAGPATVNYNDGAGYNYVLGVNGSVAAFQKIVSGTNGTVTVPAGKAYLALTASPGAPVLDITIDGISTGIDTAREVQQTGDGIFYNLAGQRVAQPTKGLYIVNGKKIIIK